MVRKIILTHIRAGRQLDNELVVLVFREDDFELVAFSVDHGVGLVDPGEDVVASRDDGVRGDAHAGVEVVWFSFGVDVELPSVREVIRPIAEIVGQRTFERR